jgi:CTP synthase
LFCNIEKGAVISGLDVPSVYQIPLIFEEEGLTEIVHKQLTIYSPPQLLEWRKLETGCCHRRPPFGWPFAASTPTCTIPTPA